MLRNIKRTIDGEEYGGVIMASKMDGGSVTADLLPFCRANTDYNTQTQSLILCNSCKARQWPYGNTITLQHCPTGNHLCSQNPWNIQTQTQLSTSTCKPLSNLTQQNQRLKQYLRTLNRCVSGKRGHQRSQPSIISTLDLKNSQSIRSLL